MISSEAGRQQPSRISARDRCSTSQDRKDALPGIHLPPRWDVALRRFQEEPFEVHLSDIHFVHVYTPGVTVFQIFCREKRGFLLTNLHLIGPRFGDASLVTAAWLISARRPETLEGDRR